MSTGKSRLEGMQAAMSAKGLTLDPRFVRSGEFREDVAYSAARSMFEQPDRPTALYVANGVMALGVLRAIADFGLKCPEDISVASTDNIPGIRGLRPPLTRAEHPIGNGQRVVRLLMDRINRGAGRTPQRRLSADPGCRRQLRAAAEVGEDPASLAGLAPPKSERRGEIVGISHNARVGCGKVLDKSTRRRLPRRTAFSIL